MARDNTKLGRLLDSQGRSGEWLAGKLGVSRSYVSHWCSKRRPIPTELIPLIARELGVHEEEVVEDDRIARVA